MAIQSEQTTQPERVIEPTQKDDQEDNLERSLRPKSLQEYVWQENIKKQLGVAIDAAKIRGDTLEHVLFYGPPGLGKTTLSIIIAHEMNGQIKHTSAPAIDKQSDAVSLLTGLQ